MEENNIDRERIFNGNQIPDEYFCPICQYLLWKPRSCSSCQHLFCEKCIRTWIENPTSANRCPFRCEPFEERRCPPYVQSLLSHLNIHCRNSSFGCTEIISYDQLEYHENVQCKYLSQRCSECDQLVLISQLDNHQQSPGLCIPHPIRCTICENYIEKIDFRKHFYECRQKRIDQLNILASFNQNMQRLLTNQPIEHNAGLTFFETVANNLQLIEQQKQMSRFPASLKGTNVIQRAQEQNYSIPSYILLMLKFILINWRKIPFFLYTLSSGALIGFGIFSFGIYLIFAYWIYTHIYFGPFLLILLTYLFSYSTCFICESVSDSIIIFTFVIFLFLCGCSIRMSTEVFELDTLFDKPIRSIFFCSIGIFLFKIILLLIRFYFSSMPLKQAAGLLTLINLYVTYRTYRLYENTLITQTNQLRMPV